MSYCQYFLHNFTGMDSLLGITVKGPFKQAHFDSSSNNPKLQILHPQFTI